MSKQLLSSELSRQKTKIEYDFNIGDLPDDILILIIQILTLTNSGLIATSKRFYKLVIKYIAYVILRKDKEIVNINNILSQLNNYNNKTLKVVVTWAKSNIIKPINNRTLEFCKNFVNLSVLILIFGKNYVSSITDEGMVYLRHLQKLTHLELDYCKISSTSLRVLKELKCIKNLRIRGFSVSTEETVLDIFSHLPLCRLGLWCGSGRIRDSEFTFLSGLTNLEELIVANCTRDEPNSFIHFGNLKKLEHIGIFHDDIDDLSLTQLSQIAALRSLHIGSCWQLTDISIQKIKKISKLTHLAITRAPLLTSVALENICELKLLCLHLANCDNIKDNDLKILVQRCTTLSRLDIESSKIITNKGLDIISMHLYLHEIRLVAMPNISDIGIKTFINCINLNKMLIKNCGQITRKGIKELVNSHKNYQTNNLEIKYKPFVFQSPTQNNQVSSEDVDAYDDYEII